MQVLAVLSIHITPCKGLAWATAIPKVFSCSRSTNNSTPEAAAVPARKASPYQTQQTLLETASAESTVLVTGWWGGTGGITPPATGYSPHSSSSIKSTAHGHRNAAGNSDKL